MKTSASEILTHTQYKMRLFSIQAQSPAQSRKVANWHTWDWDLAVWHMFRNWQVLHVQIVQVRGGGGVGAVKQWKFLTLEAWHPALKREDRLGKEPFAGFGTVVEDITENGYTKNQPILLGAFWENAFFVFLHYKINGSKGVFWP